MLCYVMLCFVMLCYVMLCYVFLNTPRYLKQWGCLGWYQRHHRKIRRRYQYAHRKFRCRFIRYRRQYCGYIKITFEKKITSQWRPSLHRMLSCNVYVSLQVSVKWSMTSSVLVYSPFKKIKWRKQRQDEKLMKTVKTIPSNKKSQHYSFKIILKFILPTS